MIIRVLSTLSLLVLATQSVYAQDGDSLAKYRKDLSEYYASIRAYAIDQLDEIHANSSQTIQLAAPRDTIDISVRSGDDWLCHNDAKFKVGAAIISANKKQIILCEPDIANAADFFLAWQLVYMSQIADLPQQADMNAPVPSEIDRVVKDRVLRLATYYIDANAKQKTERFDKGIRQTAPCFAWQVTLRAFHEQTSLSSCSRHAITPVEDDESAIWGFRSFRNAFKRIASFASPNGVEPSSSVAHSEPSITATEASSAMLSIRAQTFERLVFYVVAHEFGHIAARHVGANDEYSRQDEIEADRMAAKSIQDFYARAVALPFLSNSLAVLWRSTGGAVDMTRASALQQVVFCELSPTIQGVATHPIEKMMLSTFSSECGRTETK